MNTLVVETKLQVFDYFVSCLIVGHLGGHFEWFSTELAGLVLPSSVWILWPVHIILSERTEQIFSSGNTLKDVISPLARKVLFIESRMIHSNSCKRMFR